MAQRLIVSNNNDSGRGSLREALRASQRGTGSFEIIFVVIILQTEIISDLVSSQLHYEVHCQLFIETMFVSIRLIPVMSI